MNKSNEIVGLVDVDVQDQPVCLSGSPSIEIDVNFLLRLHNSAPALSSTRTDIVDMIKKVSEKKVKAHWARGIIERPDGTLYFDDRLYHAAVWRGKQDTYADSAEKAFAELHRAMSFVCTFQGNEVSESINLEAAAIDGMPIVPIASPSVTAAHLKQHAKALAALVAKMEGGLANGLVRPALPPVACPVEE